MLAHLLCSLLYLPTIYASVPQQSVQAKLDMGVRLYRAAEPVASLAALDGLLQQSLVPAQRTRVFLYYAANFIALGNVDKAKEYFIRLLDADPDFELNDLGFSPSVRGLYAKTKREHKIIPVLSHTPPAHADAAKGLDISVSIARMRPQYVARLYYRTQSTGLYSVVELGRTATDSYTARLLPAFLLKEKAYTLQYYVEVSESTGGVLGYARRANEPYNVPVTVPETSVAKSWWLWTIVGGVVAGGAATGVYFLARPPPTTTGNAHIELLR